MKNKILVFLFSLLSYQLQAVDYLFSAGGAISESTDGKTYLPSFVLLEGKAGDISLQGEVRDNKKLLSAKWENKYINLTGGYRYLPFNSYYLIKENNLFSSFMNPETGYVSQPVKKYYAMSFFPGKFSPGVFYSEALNGKAPMWSFNLYNIYSLVLIPGTGQGISVINLRKFKFNLFSAQLLLTIHSESLYYKRIETGYWSSEVYFPQIRSGWFLYTESGNKNRLTDPGAENNRDYQVYSEWNMKRYYRLEGYKHAKEEKLYGIGGIRVPLFVSAYGSLSPGARIYRDEATTHGTGLYYEIWKKDFYFVIGGEKREHGVLYELRSGMNISGYKAEVGAMLKNSPEAALFYSRDMGEFRKTIVVTNNAQVLFRFTGPNISATISSTNTEKGNDIYSSLQLMYKF